MIFAEDSISIDKQKLTVQVGKMAQAATTSVFGRLGDTCVLVTVTVGESREDLGYFPLRVQYVEKLYAGGRIKGSRWVKREGKPSEQAVLISRLIDRSIRPLFPKNYRKEVQIIITLLSVDGVNSPDMLSAILTSMALHLSPIPWEGPISTLRIGYIKNNNEGMFVVNPVEANQAYSTLDLVVSSTKEKVVMIETGAEELSEETIFEGIQLAKKENLKVIKFIEDFRKKVGLPKEKVVKDDDNEKLKAVLKKNFKADIDRYIEEKAKKEFDNGGALNKIVDRVMAENKDEFDKKAVLKEIDALGKDIIRENVIKKHKRVDGRGLDEIRKITIETSTLPRTHGSAIFKRGGTQVLSIVTLGTPRLEQLIEGPEGEEAKRYIHHYYMPPYSVGETGRIGYPSRREIGHGALAEKAILPVLPDAKDFPYTIRVVSEVLSSNGSTSMASTCGSTLALMDAGVPIKKPIAGIAIGLMYESDDRYEILTDIMGIEDFSGFMDFKVTGSVDGITAIQLDVKNHGITDAMIKEALKRAKKARLFLIDKIKAVINKPRTEISKFAPKVIVLTPPQDKIGEIIGPGGKNIRNLIAKTSTEINISDDGKVTISGIDRTKLKEAVEYINNVSREIEVGEEFVGEVVRILPFGAFIEILPGRDGMVHVSKMGAGYVRNPSDVVSIGEKVRVKVIQIDDQKRINLQIVK